MDDLIIERVHVQTNPRGGFVYALHIPNTNHIQIGLGVRSMNGLQQAHISTANVHQFSVHEWVDKARDNGVTLTLGKLSELFTSDPEAKEYRLDKATSDALCAAVINVHDEVWGNPNAWEPVIVPMLDGRVVWLMYDDDSDRIRIGIGFITESETPMLGDNSYALSRRGVSEFACNLYRGKAIYFYSSPPRWPAEFSPWVSHVVNLRAIAVELVRLADSVWPGEVSLDNDDEDEFDMADMH